MLSGNYQLFYNDLKKFLPKERIFTDELRALAYGTDAGFYRLIPKIVVKIETEDEVSGLLKLSKELKIPVTFRAAGTSLSGQAISDSVLAMLGPSWNKYEILENGEKIKLQPGIVGSRANVYLAPYKRKIGPDPASINSAMIGGIAANNASGMCCGTAQNSYRTLASMKIIFADGSLLDTGDKASIDKFAGTHSEFIQKIKSLSDKVKSSPELFEKIKRKFKIKNTTGYSLNALVDYDDPIDIIQHLMIGSEGTLGFIAEITYNTVPEYDNKASALMIFPDIETACKAVQVLKSAPVAAVELIDRAGMRSVENKQGMPDYLKTLDETAAALLVETRGADTGALDKQISEITRSIEHLPKIRPVEFTKIPAEFAKLWNVRKGMFPSVGAMRATGDTCIIEDVAFPIERLAEATLDLQALFKKHGYYEAIIFGHALEGNLHFVFNQNFNSPEEVERYKRFIDDVTKMVVNKYDGSLKAEHGTGRNMAPFVELEWGAEAYRMMKAIKEIFDPQNLLNPGVILNPDKNAHLSNLKPLPPAHEIVDKCIECGFCEINCPSKDLTLTPRQRIVSYREMSRLKMTGENPERLAKFVEEYEYLGDETCATDGLCALACPVEINTGNLIKNLRFRQQTPSASKIAGVLADNMDKTTTVMRAGLNMADFFHTVLGTTLMESVSYGLRKLSGNTIPLWNKYMPKGTKKFIPANVVNKNNPLKVVYFPTCINRSMGISKDYEEKVSLIEKTENLLKKAGYDVIYPKNLDNLCCGMAFASKGYKKQGDKKLSELEQALLEATNNGEYPVYVDMSPCLYRMKEGIASGLKLYEPVEFILEHVVDKLKIKKLPETVAIHTTCSSTKMGLANSLKTLAEMCAEKVIIPEGVGCCGWAGDRGFTYPELNESALKNLKPAIPEGCEHGYSTSRTCEIGLSMHSGISYTSIVYLVDRASEN
jgi:D-lactate dehydrogenase